MRLVAPRIKRYARRQILQPQQSHEDRFPIVENALVPNVLLTLRRQWLQTGLCLVGYKRGSQRRSTMPRFAKYLACGTNCITDPVVQLPPKKI